MYSIDSYDSVDSVDSVDSLDSDGESKLKFDKYPLKPGIYHGKKIDSSSFLNDDDEKPSTPKYSYTHIWFIITSILYKYCCFAKPIFPVNRK